MSAKDLLRALTEPTDRRKVFVSWDAARGRDPRRRELCTRIRGRVNSALRKRFKAVMRQYSFWRLLDPRPDLLEELATEIVEWEHLHYEGDTQWWALTKEPTFTIRRARQLGLQPSEADEKLSLMTNPWYFSTEEPKCRSEYRIFVMGESKTSEKIGISLEMNTLAKWCGSIIESAQKAIWRGRATYQNQYSLKRKLEGLMEFLGEYPDTASRHKEIMDNCMVAHDLIREADALVPAKKS